MKIAQFKNIKYDYETVGEEKYELLDECIRVSEYIDVEFEMLDINEINKEEIKLLEKQKTTIQAETQITIDGIDKRIGDLLSLPAPKEFKE